MPARAARRAVVVLAPWAAQCGMVPVSAGWHTFAAMAWRRRTARSPEDVFADEVVELVRDLTGLKATRVDGFALRIDRPGGMPTVMNLHNIYAETGAMRGDERAVRLRTAVLAMTEDRKPATWEEAAPRLLPAVRAASWVTATGGHEPDAGHPDRSFVRALVPFVSVICAIDSEHAMMFANGHDLAAWGVTGDQAMRTAVANLARMPLPVSQSSGQATILGPDGYVSSWLAVPSALAQVAADIGRTVVAVAPCREQLILLDTGDQAHLVGALERALRDYQSAPRQLSPVPYLVGGHGIQPWEPPPGHPARPVVENASRILAAVEYGQQRSVLEDMFDKADQDVFVAGYDLRQRSDGSLWSWTVWVRQVTDALIPAVDVIVLTDNDNPGGGFTVRWSDALQLAGDVLHEEAAFDPPRWRCRSWPDAGALAALTDRAVPFPPPA
jgi:hypothetical protein